MSGRAPLTNPADYSRSDCIVCDFYMEYTDIQQYEVTKLYAHPKA